MPTYRCGDRQCEVVADINWDKRTKHLRIQLSRERAGFPTHGNCELAKSIDEIDRNKLKQIGP